MSFSHAHRESVDIYTHPGQSESHPGDTVVTVGDLHGNAAKFLHLLIKEGFLSLGEGDYAKLIAIYQKSDTEYSDKKQDLNHFKEILGRAKRGSSPATLRLIGDVLADRGKNDYLQLLIYETLGKADVPYDIIMSNHDLEFLTQYSKGFTEELVIHYKGELASNAKSLHNLIHDIKANVVNEDEVDRIVQQYVLPKLKLMEAEIVSETSMNIYTHAPIFDGAIQYVANGMGTAYNDTTVYDLKKSIDSINASFHEKVKDKKSLKEHVFGYEHGENIKASMQVCNMLCHITQHRYNAQPSALAKPVRHSDIRKINIHGHVNKEKPIGKNEMSTWDYINTDNLLGLTNSSLPNSHKGSYSVFISKKVPELTKILSPKKKTNSGGTLGRQNVFSPAVKRSREIFEENDINPADEQDRENKEDVEPQVLKRNNFL